MTLASAVEGYRVRSALTVTIVAAGPGGTQSLFFGPAVLESAGSGLPTVYQPLLEFTGTLVRDGAPGVASANTEWSFRILNKTFTTGTLTQKRIGQLIRETYWIGAPVTVTLLVDDDGTWQSTILCVGYIKDTELTADYAEVRCVAELEEQRESHIPKVWEDSLDWGADEGDRPESLAGNIAPFFYGSFTPAAIGMTGISDVAAAALGVKFPMVPLALLTDRYRRPTGSGLGTTARFILLGCGDTETPVVRKLYGNSSEDTTGDPPPTDDWWYPRDFVGNPGADRVHLLRLYTWDRNTDRALPFAKDQSADMDVAPTDAQMPYAGGGCWSSEHGSHTSKTGFNAKMQTFYLERIAPDWGAVEPDYWMGLIQSIALPAKKLNEEHTTTASLQFKTTSGVTNPLNVLDDDLATYATVPTGEKLCVTLPGDGPRLGDVIHIRINVLLEAGSTSNDARLALRYNPQGLAALTPCWLTETSGVANVLKLTKNVSGNYEHHVGVVQKRIGYAAGHSQWDFATLSTSSPIQRYAWDVLVWPNDASSSLRVIRVWLEAIYRPRIADTIERREDAEYAITYEQVYNRAARNRLFRTEFRTAIVGYTGGIEPEPIRPLGSINVFASGRGPRDELLEEDWKYGGGPLETAPQMFWHWLDNEGKYSAVEGAADTFGSFLDAHAYLDGVIPLVAQSSAHMTTEAFKNVLQAHSKCFFRKQPHQSSPFYRWRCFVDTPTPDTDFPERMYRGDTKKWHPTYDMDLASLRVGFSRLPDIRNRFVLRFGMHEPTRNFAYDRILDGSNTTMASEQTAYKNLCTASVSRYGLDSMETIELPWVWLPAAADEMLKWYADLHCNRRVTVSFRTWVRAHDLLEGHVIRYDDELATFFEYPGLDGTTSWSAHMFNVVSVRILETVDTMLFVDVDTIEVYKKAT